MLGRADDQHRTVIAVTISRRHLLERLAGAAAVAVTPRAAAGDEATAHVPTASSSSGPIRLNRNESSYGPSPKALASLQRVATGAARYPDAAADDLRARLAQYHGVTADEIVVGCGSSEVMRMTVDAYADRGKRLICAAPTHTWPTEVARRAGGEVVTVPLTREYAHDLDAMRAAAGDAAGLVYICNPNNPTGTLTRRADIEAFVRALPPTVYVLIDEAYHHYVRETSGYRSFIDSRIEDPRVIVVRTFSKVFGLAGLRVGYAVAAPETARSLAAQRLADGVSAMGARAAMAALDDREYLRATIQRNADDRQEFYNQANARMVKGIDSHANFVLVNTGDNGGDVAERLQSLGMLVPRPFPRLDRYLRISLGSAVEMRAFWRAWDRAAGNMTM